MSCDAVEAMERLENELCSAIYSLQYSHNKFFIIVLSVSSSIEADSSTSKFSISRFGNCNQRTTLPD